MKHQNKLHDKNCKTESIGQWFGPQDKGRGGGGGRKRKEEQEREKTKDDGFEAILRYLKPV